MNTPESNARPGVNINTLLDGAPWGGYQKLMMVLVSLAFLTDGIANQSLGLAIPALMQAWHLPREAFASVAAIGLVGLAAGAVVGGVLGDRIGRRVMLVGSTMVFGLMTAAQAWAGSPSELLVLRLLDGLGIGAMIPNGAAMLTEFTPKRQRALALSIGMTFVGGGSMIAGLIGKVVIEPHGSSGLFLLLGGSAVVVALLLLVFLPESPIYLAQRADGQARLKAIARRCGLPVDERPIVANSPEALFHRKASLSLLFVPEVASSTICVWTALFFCLLANYSMVSWVPAMLAGLGVALSYTSLGMTAQATGGLIGGVASGWLIRRFGTRRVLPILAAGGIVTSLALGQLIRGGVPQLGLVFGLLGCIGFFVAALLNGCYTISAFIYPDHVRGTGVGAASATGRLGAIVSSYAAVFALAVGGASGYMMLIAGALVLALLAVSVLRKHVPAA